MHPAVDIAVVSTIVAHQGVDHGLWLLGCGRIVQIHQGLPMHLTSEDGEVGTDFI